jgi:hypothetical protein
LQIRQFGLQRRDLFRFVIDVAGLTLVFRG